MSLSKAQKDYEAIAEKCLQNGGTDKQLMKDKAKAFEQLRGEQREKARAGDGMLDPGKRALQAAYINRFDGETKKKVAERVLGKKV